MERPLVLINRRSGSAVRAGPGECEKRIRERFASQGVEVELRALDPDELANALEGIEDEPPSALIIGGGDGTLSAGAVAARKAEVPLGVLPLGTFNHAARDFKVPMNLEAAVDTIVSGKVERIDLAKVNGRSFLNVCVLGFYPEKIHTDDDRGEAWWNKIHRNLLRSLRVISEYDVLDLCLETESESTSVRTGFLAVSNNPYCDKPGIMPEKSSCNTGQLAFYFSTHRTRRRFIEAGTAFLAGTLEGDPDLHAREARNLTVKCAQKSLRILIDGELVEEAPPLEFSIDPASLQVIVPKEGT